MAHRYLRVFQTNAQMRASAQETLGTHNIIAPPINIFQILQNEKIPVSFRHFKSKKIEGIYLNNVTGPSIAINAVHPAVKKRFTGAHEHKHHRHDIKLGVLHCKSALNHKNIEVRANRYAAELLMPIDMVQKIIHELQSVDLFTVSTLSRAFHVAYDTAVYRLNNLRYITNDKKKKLLTLPERRKDKKDALIHNNSKNVAKLKSQCLIATLSEPTGLSYCRHCSELMHNSNWTICFSCGGTLV